MKHAASIHSDQISRFDSHGFVIGHVTPEAFEGGLIGIIKNGDPIAIDAEKRKLNLDIPALEIKARLKKWKPMKPRYMATRVLRKPEPMLADLDGD